MERLKKYIENESIKNWKKYVSYLNDDINKNDLDKVLIYMFEDVLPESILKDEKSILYTMSKSEKINLLDNSQPFLNKYIQNIFKREKDVNTLVIHSIIKRMKPYKESLEVKKKECIDHMRKITEFFVDLKQSERILLTNKSLDFSFKNKNVLTTKLLNQYELGEIFGRYLLAHTFNSSSNTSTFYKNIFTKIDGKDFQQWHILLKYWIFLFVVIELLFKKNDSNYTSLFNIKLMRKFLNELSILKYGPSQKEGKKGKSKSKGKDKYKRGQNKKRFKKHHGGGSDFEKYIKMDTKKVLKNVYKKKMKKAAKKSGEKKKYEDKNKFINAYNKILKETKVYNIYSNSDKKDDTLYNIFIDNNDLKNKISSYYQELLFESPEYCSPLDEDNRQSCDFKKKIPIIFATQNPDAYFSIENDLFANKTGPKKEYLLRTREEDRVQIINTLKEKISIYKSYYVYDDNHFNYFVKDLRTFQINLIYLIYILYLKKFNIYKTLIKLLENVMEEKQNEELNEEFEEVNFNKNNENSNNKNKSKNILKMVLTKNYKKLNSSQIEQLEIIRNKLIYLNELKDNVEKNEFGTPNYDEKINKINKFIQILRVQIEKILQ